MVSPDRIIERLIARQKPLLVGGMAVFVVVLGGLSMFKYAAFLYDGIDLAIFSQVFWNTAHGRWFEMSIHPHSFLGDHASLAILPLSLIYRLLPDPRTLLVLQVIALALAAWPLFLIASTKIAGRTGVIRLLPLFIAFAWLANPFVANAALYEFHMLGIATPFLLWSILAYERGERGRFLILAVITMSFREDLALIVGSIGILAMLEKKDAWWRYVPLALGAAWFAGAMALIDQFSPGMGSKFLAYYAWLGGSSVGDMLIGAAKQPSRILTHVFSLGTLEAFIGLGLPLLFLPYAAPRRLILAIAPFLILALGAPGITALVLTTHYGLLLLPAVMLSAIDEIIRLSAWVRATKRPHEGPVFGLITIAVVYAMLVLGPIPSGIMAVLRGIPVEARAAETVARLVPDDAPVAAGYRFLPRFADREHLYSLHYLYLGVTQFAELPYVADPLPDYLVIDEDDVMTYEAQFAHTAWARPYAVKGYANLMALGGPKTMRIGPYVLVDAREKSVAETWSFGEGAPNIISGSLDASHDTVPSDATLRLRVKGTPELMSRYVVHAVITDSTDVVLGERTFALGGPYIAYPAPAIEGVVREASISLARPPIGDYRAEVTVAERDALLVLDRLGTTKLEVTDERVLQTMTVQGTPRLAP
jgi:uncharacterized membrane protein